MAEIAHDFDVLNSIKLEIIPGKHAKKKILNVTIQCIAKTYLRIS